MISAGDQVNKTGEAKEEEYASYLSADALKGLAVATTITTTAMERVFSLF